MRFIRGLLIAGGLALFASVAGPVAASQATPTTTTHAVAGIGRLGPPGLPAQFGTPTLAVTALTNGSATGGGFAITYPRNTNNMVDTARTTVLGTVTCLNVEGNTAFITGRIKFSSGPRAGIFPVNDFIGMGVQANTMDFSPGQSSGSAGQSSACAPHQGTGGSDSILTRGHFIVR